MNISIGDKVKATKEYGGKSGTVVDIRGSFITVEYSNGDTDSYHESDLIIKNKKMEQGGNFNQNTQQPQDAPSNNGMDWQQRMEYVKQHPELLMLYKGGQMEEGVIGQEIVFDDQGEENIGVIKDITNNGDYVVSSDDGRTVLAMRDRDVIELRGMRKIKSEEKAKKRFGFFKDGGNIEQEMKEMMQAQVVEVKHHAEELSNAIKNSKEIEPWVLAKATRAKTDLSDITHYLDGENKAELKKPIYAKGGQLNEDQKEKFAKVMHEWKAGRLHSGSKNGPIVKSQDQAIAIAYAEARGMDKMAFGGLIYDDISEDSIDRMNGLVSTNTFNDFLLNVEYLFKDLEEEGFEKDEILSFLAYEMVKVTEGNKMATSGGVNDKNQFDSEYWLDYNDESGPKYLSEKLTNFDSAFEKGVKEWNSMNDDGETLSQDNIERTRKVAKQFFDKEGYITVSIIMAMISQESFAKGGGISSNYPSFKVTKTIRIYDQLITPGYYTYTGKERGGKGVYMNTDNYQTSGFDLDGLRMLKSNFPDSIEMIMKTGGRMTDNERAEKQRLYEQMRRLRELRESKTKNLRKVQEKKHQDELRKRMMEQGGGVDDKVDLKVEYSKGGTMSGWKHKMKK